MPIPSDIVENAALLMGVAALSFGLVGLPARYVEWRRHNPAAVRSKGGPWPAWASETVTLGVLSLLSGAVAGGIGSALDGRAVGAWVAWGFLIGALPAIGIGLASDLVYATAPGEVEQAELAGLPRRALARASAGGRTLAALSGGAAVCAFTLLFVASDVSPIALSAFMAGTLAVPVLGWLVLGASRDPIRARGDRSANLATPVPDPGAIQPRSPIAGFSLGAYELLAITLASSTLVIAEFPLSWFLFSDALELPMLIGSVGLWASLVASAGLGLRRGTRRRDAVRWSVGGSIAASLVGVTATVILVGGSEAQLWVPVALGALVVESISVWALVSTSFLPEAPSERASGGRRRAAVVTAALAAIVGIVWTGAFLVSGAPSSASYGFDAQVGWVGLAVAGVSIAAWAPSFAWLGGSLGILAAARGGSGNAQAVRDSSVEPHGVGPADRWPGALLDGYGAAASATAGVLAVLAMVFIVPGRDAISPSMFLPKLSIDNPSLLAGLVVGSGAVLAFSNRALGSLGGRVGRFLVVADVLLVFGLLIGPVGLTGLALGGLTTAFVLGALSGTWKLLPSAESTSGNDGDRSSPVSPSTRERPGSSETRRLHLLLLARALPVASVAMAAIFVARVTLGGV